jgi:hypothetical protein
MDLPDHEKKAIIQEHQKAIGRKGGLSKSELKRQKSRENVAKAREAWKKMTKSSELTS